MTPIRVSCSSPIRTIRPAPRARALGRFIASVPADVIVVLDEAYNEYLPPELQADSAPGSDFPNLIVSRTFSKAYGLAGLRVGYRLATPTSPTCSIACGAIQRQPHRAGGRTGGARRRRLCRRERALNRDGLVQPMTGLVSNGVAYLPSHGNFLMVRVADGGKGAAPVYEALLRSGVIVRPVANYGLPDWLRVTVGLPEENARFLSALGAALGK